MQSSIRHIYVGLIDRGSDNWRQVEAVSEGEDAYRIVSQNDRPDERWEYDTGAIVRCRTTTLPNGERVLVATERVGPVRSDDSRDPDPPDGGAGASGW
jgi:hypothetical protein